MHKSGLLYEPLPIARMGIKKETEEVIVGHDYSCFANMLEEYISFGAIDIFMPSSAPETSSLNEMPLLLKNRIKVFNDDDETETMRRLLHGLRKDLQVTISDEDQHLKFKKDTPKNIIRTTNHIHSVVRKLAVGFNHEIQIDINPEFSRNEIRHLRAIINDSQTRVILAQLEALLGLYEGVNFRAPTLPKDTPPLEIISIFDRLVNDSDYLEYSDSIAQLSAPSNREKAMVHIRDFERGIRSLGFISSGWNYIVKLIKVWTGVPIPESQAISSLIQGRSLPAFIDMQVARENAFVMWKKSNLVNAPLGRDGIPIDQGDILWIPPLDSMEIYSPNNKPFTFGKVGELLKALNDAKELFDDEDKTDV